MERLASLDGYDSIQSPAVSDNLEATVGRIGNFVDEVPGDAVAHIKVRIPAIKAVGCLAIVRLRRVGNVVFPIARIVNRMRPGVIEGRGESVPVVDPEAGLQGIVSGTP